MANIDVSPEGLRRAGEALNEARETLVTEGNVHLLHGVGDDRHISTGGFAPGHLAQTLLGNDYNRAQEVFLDIINNFIAVSSGLYIVADLFETTDQESALKFAFMDPGAEIPAGLPSHIDPEITGQRMREQAQVEQALNGGTLPDGWTRRERTTSPYSKVIEIVDQNGNVVGSQYVTYFGNRKTVSYYDANNQVISTRVETRDIDGGYVIETYNGTASPQNLIRSEHKVVNSGGSTSYRTEIYEEGERSDITDNVYVPSEPDAAPSGSGLRRDLDESEYLADAQRVYDQASNMAGNTPDTYEGPHNRVAR